jgi:hypothetical protein
MNTNYHKYLLQFSRGLLLLLIYEVIGLIINYFYRSFKLDKARDLSIKTNKKLLILNNINDVNLLSNFDNNSHVVVFDNILEYMDFKLDENVRNEVDRVSNKDIRHIYKPFYLLSSYLKTKRVFISANRHNERYLELNSMFSRLMIIAVFIIIFTLIANTTLIKTEINNLIKYMSSKTNSNFLDSEEINNTFDKTNIFIKNKINKFDNILSENSSINNIDNKVLSEVRNNLNNNTLSDINNSTEKITNKIDMIRNNIDNTTNKITNKINVFKNNLNSKLDNTSKYINNFSKKIL